MPGFKPSRKKTGTTPRRKNKKSDFLLLIYGNRLVKPFYNETFIAKMRYCLLLLGCNPLKNKIYLI
ncbi:MAG: hypothetical protein B5M56_01410 [Desulfococcus sp. 4484_241]|nr:MAG: hypothetical protein B5M56_01410 [Desulfococcus sp. 4484_241]